MWCFGTVVGVVCGVAVVVLVLLCVMVFGIVCGVYVLGLRCGLFLWLLLWYGKGDALASGTSGVFVLLWESFVECFMGLVCSVVW